MDPTRHRTGLRVSARSFVRVGLVEAWLCIVTASAVLVLGWSADVGWVTGELFSQWPRTPPWSAIVFMLLAVSSLAARRSRRAGLVGLSTALAMTTALITLTFSGVDHPWTPLGREVAESGGAAPGLPGLAALVVMAMIAMAGLLVLEQRSAMLRTTLATIATIIAMANGLVTVIGIERTGSTYGFSIATALLSMLAVTAVCAIDENVAPAAVFRKRPWHTLARVALGALVSIPLLAYIQANSSEVPPEVVPIISGLLLLGLAAGGVCWFGWIDFEAQSWRAVAENGTDMVLEVDPSGRIRSATGRCEAVTGWGAPELTGMNVAELIDPSLRERHRHLMDGFLSGPATSTTMSRPVHVHGPDGRQRLVIIRLVPVDGPDGPMVFATLNDASRESELRHRATHDPLTSVLNRSGITEYLQSELDHGHPPGVLFIDLDDLKGINDTMSHATGDEVLRSVAAAIESRLRGRDRVGRLGGDEFACVITDVPDRRVLAAVACRIADAVNELTIAGPDGRFAVTVSIGGLVVDPDGDAENALAAADAAMYDAKRAGGDHICIEGLEHLHIEGEPAPSRQASTSRA